MNVEGSEAGGNGEGCEQHEGGNASEEGGGAGGMSIGPGGGDASDGEVGGGGEAVPAGTVGRPRVVRHSELPPLSGLTSFSSRYDQQKAPFEKLLPFSPSLRAGQALRVTVQVASRPHRR